MSTVTIRHVPGTQIYVAIEGEHWSVITLTQAYLLAENRALSNDMHLAELYAGRAPRGWWARQVPG